MHYWDCDCEHFRGLLRALLLIWEDREVEKLWWISRESNNLWCDWKPGQCDSMYFPYATQFMKKCPWLAVRVFWVCMLVKNQIKKLWMWNLKRKMRKALKNVVFQPPLQNIQRDLTHTQNGISCNKCNNCEDQDEKND